MEKNITEMKRKLSNNLKARLSEKGWSQAELARNADIGRDSVNTYILQKAFPTADLFLKLCKALDMEPDQLCSGAVNSTDAMLELPCETKIVDDGMFIRFSGVLEVDTALAIATLIAKDAVTQKNLKKKKSDPRKNPKKKK